MATNYKDIFLKKEKKFHCGMLKRYIIKLTNKKTLLVSSSSFINLLNYVDTI